MLHRHIAGFNKYQSIKRCLVYVLLLLFSLSIDSCTNPFLSKNESIPNVDIPAKNINTYMKLNDDPVLENSHKNSDTLNLEIINLSKSNIVFPENFHAQVFKKEEGEWVKIGNNAYNSGNRFVLPTKDAYPLGLIVVFGPDTYITEPTTVRVSIDGFLEEDEQVRVGAYLDFQLTP